MRKIIDSNYLQSDKLNEYLSNPANQVILTDQVLYEALNSNYFKSFSILAQYPRRVFVLKRTEKISKLSFKGSGLQKRMIDTGESKRFKDISSKILNPNKRNEHFSTLMNTAQHEVKKDLERIKNEASKMSSLIIQHFSPMSKKQAKELYLLYVLSLF